jgi:hypothetical protein
VENYPTGPRQSITPLSEWETDHRPLHLRLCLCPRLPHTGMRDRLRIAVGRHCAHKKFRLMVNPSVPQTQHKSKAICIRKMSNELDILVLLHSCRLMETLELVPFKLKNLKTCNYEGCTLPTIQIQKFDLSCRNLILHI